MPRIENFVKLEIHKASGKEKELWEGGNSNSGDAENTKAWAPLKVAGQSQLHAVLGKKNKLFQFRKWPIDYGKPSQK